jgi:dihydrofolate reductase
MAAQMNAVRKVVVSTSLERAGWQNTTLVRGDVVEVVRALKEEDGANINMSGSATLAVSLLRVGLVDQLNLLIFPVVVGHGRRLFHDDGDSIDLRLLSSHWLDNGVLHVVYGHSA